VVIDRSGARRALSTGWTDWWNLAWAPRGDEIWFGAERAGAPSALYSVSLDGVERRLLQAPGTLEMHDIAPDGRVLVASVRPRRQMFGREKGASQEKGLAWLESSMAVDLSDDGRRLLFGDSSGREDQGVYVRDLSGAAAIHLGDGQAEDLSSDGKWALVRRADEVTALPTGAGVPRVRKLPLTEVAAARFLPDVDRFVLAAREGAGALRLYVADFGTEPPRPFGPEEVLLAPGSTIFARRALTVSPDGRLVAYAESGGGIAVVAVEGGLLRHVPGVGRNDVPVHWSADGRRLFTLDPGEIPARLYTVALDGSERRLVQEIRPRDPVGVAGVDHIALSRDGSAYAYSYQQMLSDLFVIEGLR
jgi:hypothetical protein